MYRILYTQILISKTFLQNQMRWDINPTNTIGLLPHTFAHYELKVKFTSFFKQKQIII